MQALHSEVMSDEVKKQIGKEKLKTVFIKACDGDIREKYTFLEKLGEGGFGTVWLAENNDSGE